MANSIKERIKDAVESGQESFWASIVEEFPESTSGDLDPGIVMNMSRVMEEAVERWVELNVESDSD